MLIRAAREADADALWAILEPVLREGETYALPRDMTREAALSWWAAPDRDVFVAETDHAVVGTYYLRRNQMGGGGHVANCGYMTAAGARGRGVARAMLAHSLEHARARGFEAIQFNFVVSTNERAVGTWLANGFEIVGRLPGAFDHPAHGRVDVFVMFRAL
jgi:ribosomal protein S18 acetylase RimI-like enzyme